MPKDWLPKIAPVESEVFWYQKPLNILQTNNREIDARDYNAANVEGETPLERDVLNTPFIYRRF